MRVLPKPWTPKRIHQNHDKAMKPTTSIDTQKFVTTPPYTHKPKSLQATRDPPLLPHHSNCETPNRTLAAVKVSSDFLVTNCFFSTESAICTAFFLEQHFWTELWDVTLVSEEAFKPTHSRCAPRPDPAATACNAAIADATRIPVHRLPRNSVEKSRFAVGQEWERMRERFGGLSLWDKLRERNAKSWEGEAETGLRLLEEMNGCRWMEDLGRRTARISG